MPAGRPSDYRDEFPELAYKLCLLGAIDRELADFFEVSEQTINAWKEAHPEFLESLKRGKRYADANVADRLYRRATGYSHEAYFFSSNKNPGRIQTFGSPNTDSGLGNLLGFDTNTSSQRRSSIWPLFLSFAISRYCPSRPNGNFKRR